MDGLILAFIVLFYDMSLLQSLLQSLLRDVYCSRHQYRKMIFTTVVKTYVAKRTKHVIRSKPVMQNSCFRIFAPKMAPTVCIAEFPMAMGTTVSSRIRHRRGSQSGIKRRRFALEQMLRTGTIVETLLPPHKNCESRRLDSPDTISDFSVVDRSAEYATNVDEDYKRLVAERRRGKKNC